MPDIVLTEDQQRVANAFLAFILDDKSSEMVIAGPAGSGKTFLMQYLIKAADSQKKLLKLLTNKDHELNLVFTATTNKAAVVMEQALGVSAGTIHSLLGLKVQEDYSNGKTRLTKTINTKEIRNSIVFIDECSLISKDLLKVIRELTTECKVVFIGDQYQLLPVHSADAPVFSEVKEQHFLTTIKRQLDNSPIIKTASSVRKSILVKQPIELIADMNSVTHITLQQMRRILDDVFTTPNLGINACRVIGWTNDRVQQYNEYIRKLRYTSAEFAVKERVITNKPILTGMGATIAQTDQIMTVTQVHEPVKKFDIWVQPYTLNYTITVYQPVDIAQANALIKQLSKNKDWHHYFNVKNSLADLRSPYAITAHKSQGSTYDVVFIDLEDIGRNNKWSEVARLLYVAITRAANKVYLVGDLPFRYTPQGIVYEHELNTSLRRPYPALV